jgi:sugar O-acyltransferase (sialic acid O-acetyltransferase NeuD family)
MRIFRVPQVTNQDDEMLLIRWLKSEGDFVNVGDIIAEVETSKAVFEIESEGSGFFKPLANPGEHIKVGQTFYILLNNREEVQKPIELRDIEFEKNAKQNSEIENQPKRWTKKAELLAKKYGIDIEEVPGTGIIQEADVERYIRIKSEGKTSQFNDLVDDIYSDNRAERVIILGGGRGAVQVLDVLFRTPKQRAVGILDDNSELYGKNIMGVKVLGNISAIEKLKEDNLFDTAIISFSNDIESRAKLFETLIKKGIKFTNVIDPTVVIHSNVSIGKGNVIMAHCRFGSCSIVGDNNFFSAYVNIEHHNVVGSHCTFGPGVMTSSRVTIGNKVKFGTGIFIEPGIKIGDNSVIASGTILIRDIPENSLVKTKVETIIRRKDIDNKSQ